MAASSDKTVLVFLSIMVHPESKRKSKCGYASRKFMGLRMKRLRSLRNLQIRPQTSNNNAHSSENHVNALQTNNIDLPTIINYTHTVQLYINGEVLSEELQHEIEPLKVPKVVS